MTWRGTRSTRGPDAAFLGVTFRAASLWPGTARRTPRSWGSHSEQARAWESHPVAGGPRRAPARSLQARFGPLWGRLPPDHPRLAGSVPAGRKIRRGPRRQPAADGQNV